MITLSIDLRQIDQSRCKRVTRRNGESATFCDLVLIETPDSEYGDFAIKQDTTKEEREAKVKMPIIGNAKIRGQKPQPKPAERPAQRQAARPPVDPDLDAPEDDIPF